MKFKTYALYFFTVFICLFFTSAVLHAEVTLQWGTYYGGDARKDYVTTSAIDKDGNVYIAGYTESSSGIATTGAFIDTNTSNNKLGFLVKFNNAGQRVWGTYIQGAINSVDCDGSGNVYIAGISSYTVKIGTPGTHKPATTGTDYDAFLMKFDGSGGRVWGTYYGGIQKDEAYAVKADANGYVYIAGITESKTGIAIPTAHKSSMLSDRNFFIAKFAANNGTREWGTYFGSDNEQEIDFRSYITLTTDPLNNVFIAGATLASNGISAGSPIYQASTASPGAEDGFLAKFSPSGTQLWGTYFGTVGVDISTGIVCDNEGYVYMTGYTDNGNITNQFTKFRMYMCKFQPTGQHVWTTFYNQQTSYTLSNSINGATPNLGRLSYHPSGFIYAIAAKPDNPSPSSASSFNASFTKVNYGSGSVAFDTVFGGSYADLGLGLAQDTTGSVYLSGCTYSTTNISTPGSFKDTYMPPNPANNTEPDGFLLRLYNADTAVFFKNILAISTGYCPLDTFTVPYGVTYNFQAGNIFKVQLVDKVTGTAYDIGSSTAVSSGSIFCTIPANIPPSGNKYKIRIIATNPGDTSIDNNKEITVTPAFTVAASGDTLVCEGKPINFKVLPSTSQYSYSWQGPDNFMASQANAMVPSATSASAGSYIVTVTRQGGCKVKDTVDVRVKPTPIVPIAYTDSIVCEHDSLRLSAYSSTPGNISYVWTGPNFATTATDTFAYVYNVKLTNSGTYNVVAVLDGCETVPVAVQARVKPSPKFVVTSNTPVCEEDSIRLFVATNATDTLYRWVGPGNFTIEANNPVFASSSQSGGTYYVYAGLDGCVWYGETNVKVNLKPRVNISSNSPLYEGDDLQFTMDGDSSNGQKFSWLGPGNYLSGKPAPRREKVADSMAGVYHLVVTSAEGCKYATLTNVVIYKTNHDMMMLYPSPNNGNFTVEGTVQYEQEIYCEVSSSANQIIGKDSIFTTNKKFKTEFQLAGRLANGQYYFRARVNGKWKVIPFTIAN